MKKIEHLFFIPKFYQQDGNNRSGTHAGHEQVIEQENNSSL
jgi:hypothetical protein